LRLVDTAGLRQSGDPVERIGIERAKERLASAGLILAVVDGSAGEKEIASQLEEIEKVRLLAQDAPMIGLCNKADLGCFMTPEQEEKLKEMTVAVLSFEAKTGRGRETLEDEIRKLFETDRLESSSGEVIYSERQKASLTRAAEDLAEAEKLSCAGGDMTDAVGVLCESALAELRMTDGRGVSEEIVNQIFERFCVGK
ncbi:MAG: hypothetical protein II797_05420, partial [Clostridia bacterium]|nr:hypothetical protein [Clostridia bacterium]